MTKYFAFLNARRLALPHVALALAGCKRSSTRRAARLRRRRWSRSGNANLVTVDKPESSIPLVAAEQSRSRRRAERDRLGLSRHLPRDSGHLAGQRPRGRHQGPPRRQREEGPIALQGAEPRRHQRIRHLSEGCERRAACQQGLPARPGPLFSTAPFRRPCWSRPRTRRRTPRPTYRGRRAVEDSRRRQEPPQPASSMSMRPSPASSSAQNVTNAAAAGVTSPARPRHSPSPISRSVWIVCDVYENDLPKVQLGQEAQIRLDAYPDRRSPAASATSARCSIPPSAPPRCASRSRIPAFLKLGMFVTATFTSRNKETHRRGAGRRHSAPARPRLGLCARRRQPVRRVEVHAGDMLARQPPGDSLRHRARPAGGDATFSLLEATGRQQ